MAAPALRWALVALLAPSIAQARSESSVTYELAPESDYLRGCFPPCLCPIIIFEDLTGTLTLRFTGATPDHFDHYEVGAVDWVLGFGTREVRVTGSGLYDIGGEFALMQRLQLDLSIDGGPSQHFDSGLVAGGTEFPVIDVSVSLNGMVCFDEVFRIRAEPLTLGIPYCTSLPSSAGLPARILAAGSARVADNDFSLRVRDAAPGAIGIFFFGAGATETPFGDGLLCIAPPVRRIAAAVTDGAGAVQRQLDLTQPPLAGQIVPGATRRFQFLYRDPPGGPAGFNLTDGLAVGFR